MASRLGMVVGIGAVGLIGGLILLSGEDEQKSSGQKAPPPPGPGGTQFQPMTIMGDSYAVGIAAAETILNPGRPMRPLGIVGQFLPGMTPAPDDGSLVILSAGTNDIAAREPDSAMVKELIRVLGPFFTGQVKNGGKLYMAWPSRQTKYADRSDKLAAMLVAEAATQNGVTKGVLAMVPIRPKPDAEDGIHFSPAGYAQITSDALRWFDTGVA